jgi:hypothetical protein
VSHGRTVCSCGFVISRCRCPGPHDPDRVVQHTGQHTSPTDLPVALDRPPPKPPMAAHDLSPDDWGLIIAALTANAQQCREIAKAATAVSPGTAGALLGRAEVLRRLADAIGQAGLHLERGEPPAEGSF